MVKKCLVILLLCLSALLSCNKSTEQLSSCLARTPKIQVVGSPTKFGRLGSDIPSGSLLDATNAFWKIEGNRWPIVIETSDTEPRSDICLLNAQVASSYPDAIDPSWDDLWHHTTAIQMWGSGSVVYGARLKNVGDGVDFNGQAAKNWTLAGSEVVDAHDDCLEDDQKNSGIIIDSLLDGCYVAFSARGTGPTGSRIEIADSLVRLKSFWAVFDPKNNPAPGHGGFFKWELGSPNVTIKNSIFRVDEMPIHGDLEIPAGAECDGNILVWGGKDPVYSLPISLTSCFTVTRDKSVWDNAVIEWRASH